MSIVKVTHLEALLSISHLLFLQSAISPPTLFHCIYAVLVAAAGKLAWIVIIAAGANAQVSGKNNAENRLQARYQYASMRGACICDSLRAECSLHQSHA